MSVHNADDFGIEFRCIKSQIDHAIKKIEFDLELRQQLVGGTVLQFLHVTLLGHSQNVIDVKLTTTSIICTL